MNMSVIVAAFLLPAVPPGTEADSAASPVGAGCETAPALPAAPDAPAADSETPVQPPRVVPTLMAGEEQAESEIVITARGAPPPGDPMQQVNVESFKVVQAVDQAVVAPIASTYEKALPKPVRKGLGNALRNLGEPVNFLNFLFQFKIGKAAETVGRFAVNSTIGVAGLFDVAKKKPFHLPHRPNGFANTLGFYGVKSGAYLYLPLVGPTSVRDLVGDSIDLLVLPVAVGKPFNKSAFAIPATTISQLNDRVDRDAEITRIRETSDDPYAETRQLYLELRQREIDALRYPNVVRPTASADEIPFAHPATSAPPVPASASAHNPAPHIPAPLAGVSPASPPIEQSGPAEPEPTRPVMASPPGACP